MIIGSVVLAAGRSERMGQNKLLLKLDGKMLIANILDSLENTGISEIVVVLGYDAKQMIEATKHSLQKHKIVINDDYKQGMTSSFQKGLKALAFVDAAFLVLGDEPIFDPQVLSLMITQMEKRQNEALIVSPIHKGKKGHPLLFNRQLFNEIMDLKYPLTIRDVVHRYSNRLFTVEAPEWTLMDIDTPEDYKRSISLAEKKQK